MGAVFGRKVLQQIRVWARDPANYNSTWAPYDGVEFTDPDYPGAVARVECDPNGREILAPSSELEGMYGADAKRLGSSVVPVQVTVDWGMPGRELRMMSYIGEPERVLPANPRVTVQRVSGPSDPVPEGGTIGFTAELRDSSGEAIPDVVFEWTLVPISGNATLLHQDAPRTGATMELLHNYVWNPLMSPPAGGPISGEVRVEVLCRYRGREIVNAPLSVQLQ